MSKTWKDRRKAKIKRGDEEYKRNNPRAKYQRPGKHELPKNELEGMPSVREGFFYDLRIALVGLRDEAVEILKNFGKKK